MKTLVYGQLSGAVKVTEKGRSSVADSGVMPAVKSVCMALYRCQGRSSPLEVRSSLLALTLALEARYVSHQTDKFSKYAPSQSNALVMFRLLASLSKALAHERGINAYANATRCRNRPRNSSVLEN